MFEEVVNKANEIVKNNNLTVFNKYWILFDNNKTPFLGCEIKHTLMYEKKLLDFYDIYFYNLLTTKKIDENNLFGDANISFNSFVDNKEEPCSLTNIIVKEKFSKNKFGSEILKAMEVLIYNNKNTQIVGSFVPNSFASNTPDIVKHFYEKNGFKILEKNKASEYLENKNLTLKQINKKLTKEDIHNFKNRIIMCPTKENNFNVIIPSDLIMCSGYEK